MQKFRKYLAFLPVLLFFACRINGQVNKKISGDFQGMTFAQFVRSVESVTDYRFFYIADQVDSITVNITVKNQPLSLILDQVLQHSDLHYAIDDELEVFVIKKFSIQTKLPADFFNSKNVKADTAKISGFEEDDYAEEKPTQKLKSSAELRLYTIGPKTNSYRKGKGTVAGYVRDLKSGEAIIGATVFLDDPPIGVSTDNYGYYSFTLPLGPHTLRISSIGMKDTRRRIELYADGKLNIDMEEFIAGMKAVVVVSEKNSNTGRLNMGTERLNIKTIKQIPVVFGEADVLRAVLALPGVTSVGEASTGFNVRGGSADQNLVLFNDASIYNPSHFFGLFSAFNPDVIKGVELYKSSIPEKFGGRLSSVLDITTRDGNKKKISGAGGIGPLTTRLSLEGPVFNENTTFLLAGRATYSDWLLKLIPNDSYKNSSAGFYDLNLHISHEMNAKNNFFITGYFSNDQFRLNSDTLYRYQNKNINLKWKHIFNNKLNGVITVGYDGYDYSIASSQNPVNAYKFAFQIGQTNFRSDFTFTANTRHSINFGLSSELYKIQPGTFDPYGKQSLVVSNHIQGEQALESALYLGDHMVVSPRLSVSAGIRYSIFNYLGPHDVYHYLPDLPLNETNITDTTSYHSAKFIKTYQGPEFRISARYSLSDAASVKISYNTLRQYIHLLSNTTAISPTDIWKLSDPNIQPQFGDQISVGFYKNLKSNTIETSIEFYYKHIEHYLDYKSGATLLLNHHIETDVLNTRGKAYGAELMIKKLSGKLNGWLSYTYSRTLLQQDDKLAGETINDGKYYPANFDRPHNVNFIGNFQINHRFSISLNVNYSTGRPITLPTALYDLGGAERVYYSQRNEYRIPDYFRTDLSMNIEGNHKIKKFKHSSWTIGVYNLTARKNPYSIFFVEENGLVKGYKLSIFGSAIPSITYNFRF